MTMSVVPVAFMTAATWIRYGISASKDYTRAATTTQHRTTSNTKEN